MMLCVDVARSHEDQQFLAGGFALDELVLCKVEQRFRNRRENLFCREIGFLLILDLLYGVHLVVFDHVGVGISSFAHKSLWCPDFVFILELCKDLVRFFKAYFVTH